MKTAENLPAPLSKYMEPAIEQAYEGIKANHGGPFGCVIIKEGEIVGVGHNKCPG